MIRQATQKRDIHTKRRRPGEDKGRGGGPAAIAKGKKRISKATSSKEVFCPCPVVVREILAL